VLPGAGNGDVCWLPCGPSHHERVDRRAQVAKFDRRITPTDKTLDTGLFVRRGGRGLPTLLAPCTPPAQPTAVASPSERAGCARSTCSTPSARGSQTAGSMTRGPRSRLSGAERAGLGRSSSSIRSLIRLYSVCGCVSRPSGRETARGVHSPPGRRAECKCPIGWGIRVGLHTA
jgi:hypothetical protein